MKYRIRFNKSRGNPGRGTMDHVWRVFDETGKEKLFKHFKLNVISESDYDGFDWNVTCEGTLTIDKKTSTAIID